jgi:hypothetical protein
VHRIRAPTSFGASVRRSRQSARGPADDGERRVAASALRVFAHDAGAECGRAARSDPCGGQREPVTGEGGP